MTTAVLTDRVSSMATSVADTALGAAARLWYLTAVVGQLVFVFAVASFYTSAAVRGNFRAWNRFMRQGYVPGDTIGNVTLAVHILMAVFIVTSGAIQLVPQIRHRAPSLHRWNGRLYMLSAFAIGIAGLYLLWVRGGDPGDISPKLGLSLNAVLIMLFAAAALRSAMARDFKTHRRWALRLFLAVSGNWFLRIGFALSFLLNKGPFGFDPVTFRGPFITFMSFASYLVPLAVLELYLRAQDRSSAPGRIAMAAGLLVLTVATGAGIFAATMAFWLPSVKAAYDGRTSIAATLSGTIASRGIEEAVKQYRDLKAAEPVTYNFDERELNTLGYDLIRARKLKEAIRIFQLNVQAYPQSSNTYDSLAEAYADDGNKPQAIANYQKAVQLKPNNSNAARSLQRLTAP
jgi:tetratricopeptide (TPR) repeat protein